MSKIRWGWVTFILIVSVAAWRLMPGWLANIPIDECQKWESYKTDIKFILDLAVVFPFVWNLLTEQTTSTEDPGGHKVLTRAGYWSLIFFMILTCGNVLASRAETILSGRIDEDANKTFGTRLQEALKTKNAELIAQFTPTLNEQKRLVIKSTEELTKQVGESGENLKKKLDASGNRLARNLIQVEDELDVAETPLDWVRVELKIPELNQQRYRFVPLSVVEKSTDNKLLAIQQSKCPNLELSITGKVLLGPKDCELLITSRMFWLRSRTIQHYLDPNHNLEIGISMRFHAFFLSLGLHKCSGGEPSFMYDCAERKMGNIRLLRDLAIATTDEDSLRGGPPSYISWQTDGTIDGSFDGLSVREQDIESPQLIITVCDPNAQIEPALTVWKNLAAFPKNTRFQIVTIGGPAKRVQNLGHIGETPIFFEYDFKLSETVEQPAKNCIGYSYSY